MYDKIKKVKYCRVTDEKSMDILRFNELIARIKFDRNALTEIYEYYYPLIIMHIKDKYPGVPAEDMAQEFFLVLLNEKLPSIIFNPSAWVYTVCDNISKRYIRDNWDIEPDCEIESENEEDEEKLDSFNIWEEAIDKDTIAQIFKLIEDDNDKKIIFYSYWLNYNSKDISKILGMKRTTIRQRHSRAIKNLKSLLFDCDEELY